MMIMMRLTVKLCLLEVYPLTELESLLFSQNRLINALVNFIQNSVLWKLLFIDRLYSCGTGFKIGGMPKGERWARRLES